MNMIYDHMFSQLRFFLNHTGVNSCPPREKYEIILWNSFSAMQLRSSFARFKFFLNKVRKIKTFEHSELIKIVLVRNSKVLCKLEIFILLKIKSQQKTFPDEKNFQTRVSYISWLCSDACKFILWILSM